MFDAAEKKETGMPWGIIGGAIALVGLMTVGYFMVT
jgi:hypothetical protein